MIDAFKGEFLINTAPLEYSGNTCSHSCLYCFQNNRRSCMTAGFKQTVNLIKKYKQSKSYTGALLREGYPIVISNRSDPFSDTNIDQTLSLFTYLKDMPNGLFIQTKGGKRIYEALEIIKDKKNVVIYISITTLSDDISKKIEPGAPVVSERIKLAIDLKAKGYEIIIAINPTVEEWMPENDILKLVRELKKYGIIHYIFQPLHLRKDYINAINHISKLENGEKIVEDALNYKKAPRTSQLYTQRIVMKLNDEENVLALWFGYPYPSKFFNAINKKLERFYPSMYMFFNYCIDNKLNTVTIDDYLKSLCETNEEFFKSPFNGIDGYILRNNRNIWKGNKDIQSIKTIKELLSIYWNNNKFAISPQNNVVMFEKLKNDKDGNVVLKVKKEFKKPNSMGSFNY